jgi:hypothetical protein
LPQPDGPMSAVKEPASQRKDTSRSAGTCALPTAKVRVIPQRFRSSVSCLGEPCMDQTCSKSVVSNMDRSAAMPMLFKYLMLAAMPSSVMEKIPLGVSINGFSAVLP